LKKLTQVFKDLIQQFRKSDLMLVAGSLSYSSLLSLFPFIALTLATLKSIGGLESLAPQAQSFFLESFKETIGSEAALVIKKIIARIRPETLGASSAIILIITSWGLLHNIEVGVQKMWGDGQKKPFMHRIFVSWIFLLLAPLILAVYFSFRSLDIVKPLLKNNVMIFDFCLVFLGLFLIYKILPGAQVKSKFAVISAVVATIALALLKKFFTVVSFKVFLISKFYGSLAAVPLLLFWIVSCWTIVLFGVTLCWSLQTNHEKDVSSWE
jgi:membrane protein